MLARSFRPLRPLIVAAALAAASATAAAPASAATTGHGAKAAKAAKAKKAKKVKKKVVAGKADLVARNLRLDFLADGGLTVDAKIANIGTGRARKSDVSIVLSSDTTFDEGDDVLGEIPMNGQMAGVERRVQTEVETPEELPDGDLYLLVCADGNGTVVETKESNNCVSQLVATDSSGEDDPNADDDGGDSDQAAIDDADDGETV